MKKRALFVLLVFMICLSPRYKVNANVDVKLIEHYQHNNEIVLFTTADADNITGVEGYFATEPMEQITYNALSESGIPIKTTIIIDTSLSIKTEEQEHFIELLTKLIDEKQANDSIAIATYGEQPDYVIEHSADRWELIKSLDRIEYKKQNSFLHNIIYELVHELGNSEEECFRRIIVFSDGEDTNKDGVIINEIYEALKTNPCPIYTIGCKYNKNSDDIKEFYSLARVSGGKSFDFVSDSDLNTIVTELEEIMNYTMFRIQSPTKSFDGGTKNILLNISTQDGISVLNTDIKTRMFIDARQEDKPEPTSEVEAEDKVITDAPKEDTYTIEAEKTPITVIIPQEEESEGSNIVVCLCVAGAIVVIAAIVIILLTGKKSKGKENQERTKIPNNSEAATRTQLIPDAYLNNQSGADTGTQFLFAREVVRLKDNEKNRVFEKTLDNEIIIGRLQQCNITVDYDMSISSRHCRIYKQAGNIMCEDLHSSNHTYLNDNMITNPVVIKTGDCLKLGRVKFEVVVEV